MMRVRGKLGNVVGFTNSASEKTNNNFYRERATTVRNPKTQKQAIQRSKVKPAAAFYSAFESILNHAFLPSQRPVKNRNKFMKKAMQLAEVPDVRKDDNYLPILPYQVSEGNLGLDYLTTLINKEAEPNHLQSRFYLDNLAGSVADFSAEILSAFPEMVEGEELTFIGILGTFANNYVRRASHFSVVLDTTNRVTKMSDVIATSGLMLDSEGLFGASNTETDVLLGGALIISSKTSSSWRYTKSFFYLTQYAQSLPNITNEVILSYMSAEAQKTSDLILQQADNGASDGRVHLVSLTELTVANDADHQGTFAPATATAVKDSLGNVILVVDNLEAGSDLAYLMHKNGAGSWVRVKRTNEGVSADVTIDTTTFGGEATLTLDDLRLDAPALY